MKNIIASCLQGAVGAHIKIVLCVRCSKKDKQREVLLICFKKHLISTSIVVHVFNILSQPSAGSELI